MVERGEDMVKKGRRMDWGETVVEEGHEMKKEEMIERGNEMIQRGQERIERGRRMRKRDVVLEGKDLLKEWVSESKRLMDIRSLLANLPLTVMLIAGISGWLVLEWPGYTLMAGGTLINPLYYVELLFWHSDQAHYLSNIYFFVPAGVALTYLTSNKNVLIVVAVSHFFTVLLGELTFGWVVGGITVAAYGLLAATAVRAAHIGSERYTTSTQTVAPAVIFVISASGILLIGSISGPPLQNIPLVIGFVFGGTIELLRSLSETRRTEGSREDDWRGTTHGQNG